MPTHGRPAPVSAAVPDPDASLDALIGASEATHGPASLSGAELRERLLADPLVTGAVPPALDRHGQELIPRYPCGTWWWLSPETGERRPFHCGSWKCPACGYRRARSWVRLLQLAPVQRHVVFTRLASTPEAATDRLRGIIKAIRRGEAREPDRNGRRRPCVWEYFATSEHHARAGIHLHLLQHGAYLPQRDLAALLDRYGAGRVCWLERIDPVGRARTAALATYVTHHLVAVDHPHQPRAGVRRLRYSRRFWPRSTATLRKELAAAAGFSPDPEPWILVRARLT